MLVESRQAIDMLVNIVFGEHQILLISHLILQNLIMHEFRTSCLLLITSDSVVWITYLLDTMVDPRTDPKFQKLAEMRRKAVLYYKENQVPQLMESALNKMFFEQPDDVYAFLVEFFQNHAKTSTIDKVRNNCNSAFVACCMEQLLWTEMIVSGWSRWIFWLERSANCASRNI